MSTIYLRLIPQSPTFVPTPHARWQAKELFERMIDGADELDATVTEDVQFVDAGGNLHLIACPKCGHNLDDWWTEAATAAYENRFRDLNVELPCCGATCSLNDLHYELPVGFARFVLEARDPHMLIGLQPKKRDLTPDDLQLLEQTLGCPLRRIWARI